MKKNHIILTISILFLIISLSIILTIFFTKNNNVTFKNTSETLDKEKQTVTLMNSSITIMPYSDGKMEKTDQINLIITLYSNMYSETNIKDAQIKNINIKSTSNKYNNYKILPPTDINRTTNMNYYYQPISNNDTKINEIKFTNSNSIKYLINSNTEISTLKTNEINKNNGTMEFKIFIPDIGKYNYDEILKRDNVFASNKLLAYANMSKDDLNATVSFVIYIVTEDNVQHTQNIIFDIDGEKLVESGLYNKDDFNNIKF